MCLHFCTSRVDLLGNIPEKQNKRQNICLCGKRNRTQFTKCTTMHGYKTKSPAQTLQQESSHPISKYLTQSIPYSHPLSKLPKPPNSFHISPAIQLKQCSGGTRGPVLPLMSARRRHRETACPADQQLNFILNGTQHPSSMKWSLIIKLKSLSAEQFK